MLKRKRTQKPTADQSAHGPQLVEEGDELVLRLEEKILESRKNYNDLTKLIQLVKDDAARDQHFTLPTIATCRTFCRLMANGHMSTDSKNGENDKTVALWLAQRQQAFVEILLPCTVCNDSSRSTAALTLLLRLAKQEYKYVLKNGGSSGRTPLLNQIVDNLLRKATAPDELDNFVKDYMDVYDDVRLLAIRYIKTFFVDEDDISSQTLENVIIFLSNLQPLKRDDSEAKKHVLAANTFFDKDHGLFRAQDLNSSQYHKKTAQAAWIAVLSQHMTKAQRKKCLELVPHCISQWLLKPELLMDFLTDSFNVGGSTALSALSGIFYLITEHNLDYPQFYSKLYSMLDEQVLHSTKRSRFLRLLNTFLSSTHLPAALIASFVKRMSRLGLFASPPAIVSIIPWIYNLLKAHPQCTFMIHRSENSAPDAIDRFDMNESDPLKTRALDSSLWEIHSLQTHYHPNVATIAKCISEQFTKSAYNVDDFLDHSYATMLEMELAKAPKRAPEIEFHIPKKIFSDTETDCRSATETQLASCWRFDDVRVI